jgi:hypothetical protein
MFGQMDPSVWEVSAANLTGDTNGLIVFSCFRKRMLEVMFLLDGGWLLRARETFGGDSSRGSN